MADYLKFTDGVIRDNIVRIKVSSFSHIDGFHIRGVRYSMMVRNLTFFCFLEISTLVEDKLDWLQPFLEGVFPSFWSFWRMSFLRRQ